MRVFLKLIVIEEVVIFSIIMEIILVAIIVLCGAD